MRHKSDKSIFAGATSRRRGTKNHAHFVDAIKPFRAMWSAIHKASMAHDGRFQCQWINRDRPHAKNATEGV
jgi:hypothetical protein